ncbi:MAG TPA: hypothetical protein DHU89_05960 [Flavobacteriales bacterium]|nr:hypothetical protein [Flavobacteriales bacterium]|tara:strand:+ start:1407 stop:1646 length:240 start_codon:yes stop_codon:yes gene_type:complete
MRVIAEIPHSHFKIQIFSWNGKYQLKIEIDQYEQTYKVSETNVKGLDDVKALITEDFLSKVMGRMISMREDWNEALKSI